MNVLSHSEYSIICKSVFMKKAMSIDLEIIRWG